MDRIIPDNLRMSDTQQVCMFVEYLKKKQTMQKNILRIDLSIMELYELYTSSSLLRKKSTDSGVTGIVVGNRFG